MKKVRFQQTRQLFLTVSWAHLTVSLILYSSGSNARGESRVQDGDKGVAGRNGREKAFPNEESLIFSKRKQLLPF